MHALTKACAAIALGALISGASAQQFPAKPMRMIVPTPPAGSADIMGRLIAEHLGKRLGQTMITENRPGAGQTIGTAFAAKAEPDGHTLVLVTVTVTTSAAIYKKLPYDPVTDLTGVALLSEGPLLLTVHPSLPVKSVKDLIALARAKPGTINFGSAGTGSIPHFAFELFAHGAKLNIVHVPYKGIAPAVVAAVSGEVPALFASTPAAGTQVKAGRLRALAVTTAKRATFMPELPTLAEAGVPGYDVATWWGVLAPGRTPAPIVARLNEEIRRILATDEVRARIIADGAEPVLDMTPEKFNALIRAEIDKWRRLVKERGIEQQ
jgi:tripartite-type tricarboxylate transporter receptor subunit TctC